MNLIEFKDLPNIYGVKVPKWANDFRVYFEFGHTRVAYNKVAETELPLTNYSFQNLAFNQEIKLQPLGTITATEISFDVAPYIRHLMMDFENYGNMYQYIKNGFVIQTFNHNEYFRSALPKEIFFENPLEKPNTDGFDLDDMYDWNLYYEDCEQYQTAQQNITEKLLILQKL